MSKKRSDRRRRSKLAALKRAFVRRSTLKVALTVLRVIDVVVRLIDWIR